MPEQKHVLLIAAGVIGLIVVVIFTARTETPERPVVQYRAETDTSAGDLEEIPLVSTVARRETMRDGYTLNIEYPKLALARRPDLAAQANDVIARAVQDTIDAFASDLKSLSASEESAPVLPSIESSFTLRSTVMLLSPSIISVRFDSSGYVAGAAHPNNRSSVLNYSLSEQVTLRPTDLFASSSDPLSFLSDISRTALRTRMSDQNEEEFRSFVYPGTEPTMENFSNIGITPNGLVVIFTPYQVAPGAMGALEVPLPTSEYGTYFRDEIRKAMTLAVTNIELAKPVEVSEVP